MVAVGRIAMGILGICRLSFGIIALGQLSFAEQIRFAGRLQKGLISDINVNLETATNALNAEEIIYKEFKNNPPTIIEALNTAINLEEQLYEFHLEYSVSFQNESYRKLFHTMLNADKEHIESLKKALQYTLKCYVIKDCNFIRNPISPLNFNRPCMKAMVELSSLLIIAA